MSLKNLQTKAGKLMDHADVFAGWVAKSILNGIHL